MGVRSTTYTQQSLQACALAHLQSHACPWFTCSRWSQELQGLLRMAACTAAPGAATPPASNLLMLACMDPATQAAGQQVVIA